MTIDDYESVYLLWTNTAGLGLNKIDDSEEGIRKYLKRNPSSCFVAEENGEIIGAILGGNDGRRGTVSHIAVSQKEKGKGIGKALLNAVTSALAKEGIKKAWIVVFKDNEQGNLFWEKQGFATRPDLVYRNKVIS